MENEISQVVRQTAEAINAFIGSSEFIAYPSNGLPDKGRIIQITEQLRSVMFPGYFDAPSTQNNAYAAGYKLARIGDELQTQAYMAFCLNNDAEKAKELAKNAVTEFIRRLPETQKLLETDTQALYNGDPAAESPVDVIFSYPGLFAITVYRLAHVLYILNVPLIPRMMTEYAHSQTGIDINAGATIGSYFFIDHGTGVVIGETTVIGDYVKLYQGVTLGALSTRKGHMLSGVKRHPTIGNRVTVYAGASILGGETVIGDDCLIGSNAFVTGSVPANTKVSITSPELTFRENKPDIWEVAND